MVGKWFTRNFIQNYNLKLKARMESGMQQLLHLESDFKLDSEYSPQKLSFWAN